MGKTALCAAVGIALGLGCTGNPVGLRDGSTEGVLDGTPAPDQYPVPDRGQDDWTPRDMAPDRQVPLDLVPPDSPGGPPVCAAAIPIPLVNSTGQASGTIPQNDTSNLVTLKNSDCANAVTPGADRFYSVSLTGGQKYVVSVQGQAGFLPAVYVFSDCSAPGATCIGGSSGNTSLQQLAVSPKQSGTYYIGVDSSLPMGLPGTYGSYTVSISAGPGNDQCSGATALSLSGGTTSVTASLVGASSSVNLPSGSCGSYFPPTVGPDLFFSLNASASKGYIIELDAPFDAGFYVFTDCANVSGSCVAGAAAPMGATSTAKLAPKQNGTYYIGVDTLLLPPSPATFTLKVTEYTVPANNQCSGATTLTFTGGKATATGDTTMASDTSPATGYNSCFTKPMPTPGPDLYYAFTPTAGKGYKLSLTPTGGTYDLVAYVFTGCSNPYGTCVAAVEPYMPGALTTAFMPTGTGTHYIAVDSTGGPGAQFGLELQEYTPPTNTACSSPQALTWSNGKATASGDTSQASNDITGVSCGGYMPLDGPQLYYTVTLPTSDTYIATVQPNTGSTAVLYAVPASTSCTASALNAACTGSVANQPQPGAVGMVALDGSTTAEWLLVVEGGLPYYGGTAGPFTLTVEQAKPPANDTCASAKLLTVPTWGGVTETGHTVGATDTVSLPSSGCTWHTTAGPDRFYKVQLQAGQYYYIDLYSGFDAALYLFTDCANPGGTCKPGMGADQYPGQGSEYLSFTPPATGTYYVAVDGKTAGDQGTFTLNINGGIVPPPPPFDGGVYPDAPVPPPPPWPDAGP